MCVCIYIQAELSLISVVILECNIYDEGFLLYGVKDEVDISKGFCPEGFLRAPNLTPIGRKPILFGKSGLDKGLAYVSQTSSNA